MFTSRATIGEIKIAAAPVSTNQGFKNLSPKPNIDGIFLFYQIQRLKNQFLKYAAGSTFLEINRKDIGRVKIPHPSKNTIQNKIGEILQNLDHTIEKTEALIKKYQQIKAGLMHDLFTRGITADGKLRPPREQAPELYQETPIGWIPRDWTPSTLRPCLIDNPTNGVYKPAELIGEGALMVGQTAFTKERSVDFSLCRRGQVTDDELRQYGIAKNNILVTRVFATVDGVGLPTLVPDVPEPSVYESNMMRLRVAPDVLVPRLLFEWLRSPKARNYILTNANASNQVSVNQVVLNKLPVSLMNEDEQRKIVIVIEKNDKKIADEKDNLSKLKQMKSGLMHDLLTGKVQVNVDQSETIHAT